MINLGSGVAISQFNLSHDNTVLTIQFISQGAIAGPLVSFAVMMWICIGKYTVVGVKKHLPFPTQNCPSDLNLTTSVTLVYPDTFNYTTSPVHQYATLTNLSNDLTTFIPNEEG
jgi:hypothetical protein